VLGRNGVGKTSLLRTILGLEPVRSGRIVWEDQALGNLPPYERARAGVRQGAARARDLCAALGPGEPAHRLRRRPAWPAPGPPRRCSSCSRRSRTCSGAAAAIFRAAGSSSWRSPGPWSRAPRLLLLDEPTEGIQPSIIKQIAHVISRLAAGGEMAILLVEQYLDCARSPTICS
jgi:urea transport system ATP-binding protein